MNTDELEKVRSLLAEHRQKHEKKQKEEADKQKGEEFKPMHESVARMHKAREQAKAQRSNNSVIHDKVSIGDINDKANVTDYLVQGDLLLSPEQARRMVSGQPLGDTNQTLPSWWHNMGKNGGSKHGNKSEVARKIKLGLLTPSADNGGDDKAPISKRQAINPTSSGLNLWAPVASVGPWPYLPYKFDTNVAADMQARIQTAVGYWNDNTCIYFSPDSSTTPNVKFTSPVGQGCFSGIGRQNPTTTVTVSSDGCDQVGVVTHEAGHAAGFWHEMLRTDRDSWVNINSANIQSGKGSQFNPILTASQNSNYGNAYDYGSIMSYGSDFFGVNGAQTIVSKASGLGTREWDQSMGSLVGGGPSIADYKVMNALYNCAGFCSGSPLTCANGGFQNPNNCANCVCPQGTGGSTCSTILPNPSGYAPSGITNTCTGSKITVSNSGTWTTLSTSIGSTSWETASADNDVAYCHWYLQAPSGYHLTIEVQSLYTTPQTGSYTWSGIACGAGFTEVRVSTSTTVADWSKTGRRMCQDSDLQAQGGSTLTFNSVGRDAIVSSYTNVGTRQFTLRYKAVAN